MSLYKIYSDKLGFSIIEVLIVGAIASVIMLGTLKILFISTQSSNVVRASLSEQDLRMAISNILHEEDQCRTNLEPGDLTGTHSSKGAGTIAKLEWGNTVIETGQPYKNDLEIVEMELWDQSNPTAPNDPTGANGEERVFTVYYKKQGVGNLNTLNNEDCDSSNKNGCYYSQCTIGTYKLNGSNVALCRGVKDCISSNSGTGGGGNVDCYTVRDEHDDKKTLIGCGGTNDIGIEETVAFGFGAGKSISKGGSTFIGYKAGADTVGNPINSGDGGFTFIGHQAGQKSVKSSYSTFIGYQAGQQASGQSNTIIGYQAGKETQASLSHATFIGYQAGFKAQGFQSVAIGAHAGEKSDGAYNVLIGYKAGQEAKNNNNTFIGYDAGKKYQGAGGVFIGYKAGHQIKAASTNPSDSYDILIGYGASQGVKSGGGHNVVIGYEAGPQIDLTNFQNNIFIGSEAGQLPTTGASNSIILKAGSGTERKVETTTPAGDWAKNNLPGNGNNILIGSFSSEKEKEIMANNSNYMWIHDLIEGNRKEQWVSTIKNNLETENLYAYSLQSSSDKRLKTDLNKLEDSLQKINKLEAYSFRWKEQEKKKGRHFGFIAQETKKILPEVVEKDRAGFFTINYPAFVPLIVSAFQEFYKEVKKKFKFIEDTLKNLAVKYENVLAEQKNLRSLIEKQNKDLKTLSVSVEKLKQENKALKEQIKKKQQLSTKEK